VAKYVPAANIVNSIRWQSRGHALWCIDLWRYTGATRRIMMNYFWVW